MRVIDQVSYLWKTVYLIILIAGAIAATIFPVLYISTVRWWESPMGKYMMFKGIVLMVTLDLGVVRIFVPDLPVWVSFAILLGVAVMLWWMVILFIVTYVKGKKKRLAAKIERRKVGDDAANK